MSQSAGAYIYTGPWINWTHGFIQGSTVTLSTRDGAILIAFLALLVKFAGGQSWGIIKYATHQLRASQSPRDGLHHQSQAILRNADSANQAVLEHLRAPLYWRKHAERPFKRSIAVALLPLVNLSLFGLAGIFSSEVSKAAGDEVLIRSDNCGAFDYGDLNSAAGNQAFQSKTLNDTLTSAAYARDCYEGNGGNVLHCNQYAQSRISYTVNKNATCPFSPDLCRLGDTAAYEMDSGQIDSHAVLGINARPADRVTYRKVVTCSPIITSNHVLLVNGSKENGLRIGDTFEELFFGPVLDINFTYLYGLHAVVDQIGYTLIPLAAYGGNTSTPIGWQPIAELNQTDSDISLLLLAANSIRYASNVSDPWFSAHDVIEYPDGSSVISSDYYINPLACIDQNQFCSPTSGVCTPLSSLTTASHAVFNIGLNPAQLAAASRMFPAMSETVTASIVQGRGAASLRAQESVYNLESSPLPEDQWMIELDSWFSTALAILQDTVVQFAAGPPSIPPGSSVTKVQPTDKVYTAMCHGQKVRGQSNFQSFSVLGLSVIVVFTCLLTVLNFLTPLAVRLVRRIFHTGQWKSEQWAKGDKLQLQRMVFESRGLGTWSGDDSMVPVTSKGERFPVPGNGSFYGHSIPGVGPLVPSAEERDLMTNELKPGGRESIEEVSFKR